MMEVILGALIALIGSIIIQFLVFVVNNRIKEKEILHSLNILMLRISPILHDKDLTKKEKLDNSIVIREEMSNRSIILVSKKNRYLARDLIKIALDFDKIDEKFFDSTLRKLQIAINKKLILLYENG